MAIVPVRGLGTAGIVTDIEPYDIENPAVFSAGVNVRFRNGRASRGPIARTVHTLDFQPGHILTIPPSSGGYDEIVAVAADFSTIKRKNGAVLENLTPPTQAAGVAGDANITSTSLGGVSYINRETHRPVYKAPGNSTYLMVPNLPTDIRARSLRAYGDQLIALGVTKAGVYYPTMVKWSDFATFGGPPASWDPTITTNSAGENIVNKMEHPIVDGYTMRTSFVIYCTKSVWAMDYNGGDFIFNFVPIFEDRGLINANCVAQVGGSHYVFDSNDIYVHDGVTPTSICDAKVREFIFSGLDSGRSHLCFVNHDARLSEVRFCYPSADRLVGFRNPTDGCNRAAVYSYVNGTWTFYDMPNVTSGARAALVSGKSWASTDETWDDTTGLFQTSEGDENQHVLYVGRTNTAQGITAPRIYGLDILKGGTLTVPIEPEALKPAILERTGLDLDFLGKHLNQYVHLQHIWPQLSIDTPEDSYWQFGANDLVNVAPVWSESQTFDPKTESKMDLDEAGKYLAYRMVVGGTGDFQLSGFDVQIVIRGRR